MAQPNSYDIGSQVTLTGTFKNASGALTDPSTVTCSTRDPAGTLTTNNASKVSTGIWSFTVDLSSAVAGLWRYRFAGTGALVAAEENSFFVEPSYVLSQEP